MQKNVSEIKRANCEDRKGPKLEVAKGETNQDLTTICMDKNQECGIGKEEKKKEQTPDTILILHMKV